MGCAACVCVGRGNQPYYGEEKAVKRNGLFLGTGLVVLAGVIWLSSGSQAQVSGQMALSAAPRIATLNFAVVSKNYKKFEIFSKEMEEVERPYREKAKELYEGLKKCEDYLREGKGTEEQRNQVQKNLVAYKRAIEDNNAEAAKVINARRNEKLVQLYHEIQDAAARYARANGIQIVFQYAEPTAEPEIYAPGNILRKLQASGNGSMTPLYIADGIDITQQVVNLLNTPFTAASSSGAAGSGGH